VDWPLSYEKLEDCVEDKGVRRNIEAGLRQYVLPDAAVRGAFPEHRSENDKDTGSETSKADVFISHATEDKPYVEPLVEALQRAGLQVWYDRVTLEWGDDLRGAIDHGLANCRFGIVVFSDAFLRKKKWTEYEVNALFARETLGQKVILPIWHGVTREDVLRYSPAFADRLAKDSSNDDYGNIVATLLRMLNRDARKASPNPTSQDDMSFLKAGITKNATAVAHATYEMKGSSSRAAAYVRGTDREDVYVFESSMGNDEFGSKEEIALRFVTFDKQMRMKGFTRMNYGNGGDRAFDL
jgi:hypothetical protein